MDDLDDDEPFEVTEDYPFEGAKTMSLTITLGSLMMAWPLHESILFRLFVKLSNAPNDQARAIWTSIVSLDMRLRIMDQLAALERRAYIREGARACIAETRRLSEIRNKYTHWNWLTDGKDWKLESPKRHQSVPLPVSPDDVKALTAAVNRADDALIKLVLMMDGKQIGREPE